MRGSQAFVITKERAAFNTGFTVLGNIEEGGYRNNRTSAHCPSFRDWRPAVLRSGVFFC